MLSINNISYYIGGRALYENASLHIKPKDRIGLIGLNGQGKSTLLRLIVGEYRLDSGEIQKANDCSIGFLNQDLLSYESEESILNVAMQAFSEALEIQRQIDKVLKQMETHYEDKLVDRLSRLQEQFEALEGYTIQSRAEEILEGIGFTTKDLQRPLKEFSGGWRMRVMLAKLLLEKPSLLLMDEPTNHLDLPSIQWIENYLRNYEGAYVIVSHDRQFLDNTTDKTVEVANETLTTYSGNYSFYLEEKKMRQEIQQNAYENQQQKIRQTERFIERFRAKSTKARQVQSRVKALERMDKVDEVMDDNATVNFKFNIRQKSGRNVLLLDTISKSYGELQLLKNTTARIERGDKIALIGANGKGKSTLLRIIAGTEPHEGKRETGHNVALGFYAQHQLESLTINNEILEELKQAGSDRTELELRNLLGCFLFQNEDVFKKIKVLSGGEKSRVALAKTMISEANFLLLDEPTNHLDMLSENILIQALQQYEGTCVIVSHNRHFIRNLATKIWFIEDMEVKEYPGSYDEFVWWMENRATSNIKETPKVAPQEKPKKEVKPKASAEEEKAIKEKKKQLAELESQIAQVEHDKQVLEQQMAKPEVYEQANELEKLNAQYKSLSNKLEQLQEDWENHYLALEELEN
jgi:ATP-binding cassette, subfamily F, member 3